MGPLQISVGKKCHPHFKYHTIIALTSTQPCNICLLYNQQILNIWGILSIKQSFYMKHIVSSKQKCLDFPEIASPTL